MGGHNGDTGVGGSGKAVMVVVLELEVVVGVCGGLDGGGNGDGCVIMVTLVLVVVGRQRWQWRWWCWGGNTDRFLRPPKHRLNQSSTLVAEPGTVCLWSRPAFFIQEQKKKCKQSSVSSQVTNHVV